MLPIIEKILFDLSFYLKSSNVAFVLRVAHLSQIAISFI